MCSSDLSPPGVFFTLQPQAPLLSEQVCFFIGQQLPEQFLELPVVGNAGLYPFQRRTGSQGPVYLLALDPSPPQIVGAVKGGLCGSWQRQAAFPQGKYCSCSEPVQSGDNDISCFQRSAREEVMGLS